MPTISKFSYELRTTGGKGLAVYATWPGRTDPVLFGIVKPLKKSPGQWHYHEEEALLPEDILFGSADEAARDLITKIKNA